MHSFRCKTHIMVISHRFDALKSPFGFAPHTLHLKLMFRVVSRHSLLYLTHYENHYRVHQMHEFMPPKPFLVLSQQTCPIHYFSLKLMFWVVPSHFVAAIDTLQKPDRGAFNARVYAFRTVSCFFAANMSIPLLSV